MTSKKKADKSERKIYRDFTLDEFDVFTMDLQCEGASHERGGIVSELQRRMIQLAQFSEFADNVGRADEFAKYSAGLRMAINIIEKMPQFEDRCGCVECGAI